MSSGDFESRRGNFPSLRIEAFVCNGEDEWGREQVQRL